VLVSEASVELGKGPHIDFNQFIKSMTEYVEKKGFDFTAKRKKLIQSELAMVDEKAKPVIKIIYKKGKKESNPLYGTYEIDRNGKSQIVEYEPDANLSDTEHISLSEKDGIEGFFKREVLPYISDAWIDPSKTKTGYEISFTRYFYKPVKIRTLEEIQNDIFALEKETEGILEDIVGETK